MLKSIAQGVFGRLGLRAMRARTYDAARARTRELEELVAVLRSTNHALEELVATQRAVNRELEQRPAADVAGLEQLVAALQRDYHRLTTELSAATATATVERAGRLAALDQLAQVQTTLRPPATSPPTPPDQEHDAGHWTARGEAAEAAGDVPAAVRHYARAMQLIPRFTPARDRLAALSVRFLAEADEHHTAGRTADEKRALVRAVELNQSDRPTRDRLAALLATDPRFDITQSCGNYQDQARGEAVFREAFLRAAEYVSGSGVVGEFFEFGVYGGFTARIQSEIIRDLEMWREIHLFDSFEGLPAFDAAPDRTGYDTAVRKVWAGPMCHSAEFIDKHLGCPVDVAIYRRLTEILGPDRVYIYRGFFSDTLPRLPQTKAALVHVDCDIYSSAREVLFGLYDRDLYQDGCVLMFDDWNCFRANPAFGERRAFREFLEAQTRFTATPFFTYGWCGAAFILHDSRVTPDA